MYVALVDGKLLLMRMQIEGGQPQQLTDDQVNFVAISPDGQQVAMLTFEGDGVQARPVIKIIPSSGGAPIKTLGVSKSITGFMQYSADGKSIYYPVTEKGVSNFLRQSLDGGDPTPVTNFQDLASYGYSYNWPAHRLAVARGRSNSDIVLITQQQAAE
jgi:Tol biopolymer transport system component